MYRNFLKEEKKEKLAEDDGKWGRRADGQSSRWSPYCQVAVCSEKKKTEKQRTMIRQGLKTEAYVAVFVLDRWVIFYKPVLFSLLWRRP